MSDFLTRLIERTLGLAEVVQPLVTPLHANEPIEKDDILSSLQPDQDSVPRKPLHKAIAGTNKSENYPIKEVKDGPSSPAKSGGDVIAQPREFVINDKGKKEVSQRKHLNISPTRKPDKHSALVHDKEGLLIPEKTQVIGKGQATDREMNFKHEFPVKKALVPEVSNNLEFIKTSSMDRQFTNMAVASENTHIKISIGRIEVKATTPPVPARTRHSRPGPRLTLEDYLKQRNDGKR